jgi:hypothetical protein
MTGQFGGCDGRDSGDASTLVALPTWAPSTLTPRIYKDAYMAKGNTIRISDLHAYLMWLQRIARILHTGRCYRARIPRPAHTRRYMATDHKN